MKFKATTVIKILGIVFIIGVVIYLFTVDGGFGANTDTFQTIENNMRLNPGVRLFEVDGGESFDFKITINGLDKYDGLNLLISDFEFNRLDCAKIQPRLVVNSNYSAKTWVDGSFDIIEDGKTQMIVKVSIPKDLEPGDYWVAVGLEESGLKFVKAQIFGTYFFRVGEVETEPCIKTWLK